MRVIIAGPAYPLRGGIATYTEHLAHAFQDAGDEVIIYTFSLQYPKALFPGKTQYSTSEPPADLNIKIAINSINPLNWAKVGNEINELKPDLLIINFWIPFMGPSLGKIARQAKKNGHTKVITIVHNIIPHEKRPGDGALTKYFIKPVDGFIVQSHSVEEDLQQFNTSRPVAYNPHPILEHFGKIILKSDAKAMLQLEEEVNYMLFFGFIRSYKGLDILLEAMADERLKSMNVKLIIAGEYYEDSGPYKKIIKENDLEENVIAHTHFIPDEEVYKYFNACDVVVQPYKSATQSGVTQIAYHFNKPMIVTNVGGLPEMIPDGKVGFVVDPDPEAIADAIFRFYNEKKEARFAANAAQEKLKYSWSEMVAKIKQLAQRV